MQIIFSGDEGHLLWNDNWVSYLDTMLQIQVLSLPGRGLRLPTRMKALRIDPTLHNDKAVEFQGVKGTDSILHSMGHKLYAELLRRGHAI